MLTLLSLLLGWTGKSANSLGGKMSSVLKIAVQINSSMNNVWTDELAWKTKQTEAELGFSTTSKDL